MNNKILIGIIAFLLVVMGVGAFCMHSNHTNIHKYMGEQEDNMEGHCDFMPEMDGCEKGESGKIKGEHDMGMSDDNMTNNTSNNIPVMPGQEAFGTIQEIINILDKDPNTDWSKVNIDSLREHLIDMDQLTMYSHVERENISNGLKMTVTGTGKVLAAINRMVLTHKQMTLDSIGKWDIGLEKIDNGVILTVTSNDKEEVKKIRGLGFIGIMAIGSKHPAHHLMMAKGQMHMLK